MERGREHAIAGLEAARAGDLEAAQAQFAQADAAFAEAADALDHPAVRLGDAVPVAAQNLRNARVLADIGQDLSGTAIAVSERAGADDLQMVDGVFPLDAAADVGDELGGALATLTSAAERLHAADSPLLLEEVRRGAMGWRLRSRCRREHRSGGRGDSAPSGPPRTGRRPPLDRRAPHPQRAARCRRPGRRLCRAAHDRGGGWTSSRPTRQRS